MDEGKAVNIYVTQTIQGNVEGGQVTGVDIAQLTGVLGGGAGAVVERRIPRVAAPRRQDAVALVGRDELLQGGIERLQKGGKVYFYGTYGVGKTALASELFNRAVQAREPADGYLWGSLAGMSTEDALEWIAGALQEGAVAQAAGGQAKINLLRQAISLRKDLLIGLDEVRDGEVAQALIEASGSCALILNGTRSLDLAGLAATVSLRPLGLEEARGLFVALAYPAGTELPVDDSQRLDQILNRLGRLPLSVRLAARSRQQGVSLERLLDMLQFAPGALLSAEAGLKAYLESLRGELQGMPVAMQALLRLAAFPAHHAPLEPLFGRLHRMASPKDATIEIPKRTRYETENFLVEREFVSRREGDRLELHSLLALWLENAEEGAYQAERTLVEAWLVDYAGQHSGDYDLLEVEQANLLGLLERFRLEERWDDLVALLRNLFRYLRVRGLWGMNIQALEAALEHLDGIKDPHLVGWSYLHRGIMHTLRGELEAARADLDQADQVFTQIGNTPYRGKTLYRRAALTQMAGDLDEAAAQLEQALAWMSDQAPLHDRAGAHELLATVYATSGRREEAEAHYQQAIDLGDPEVQARAHIQLGALARQAGDREKAEAHYQQTLGLAERLGHVLQRGILSQELGYLYYQGGSYDLAEQSFRGAGMVYTQLNFPLGLAHVQHALGNVAFARRDLEAARHFYQAALEINQTQGVDANASYNRYMLAVVAHRQGDLEQAGRGYDEALEEARAMGDLGLQASVLYQSANLAFERGEAAAAGERVGQAQALAGAIDDRQTEASALALLGRLQAQEGHAELARGTLAQAHALFAAFNAVDAEKVARIQAGLGEAGPDVVSSGGMAIPPPAPPVDLDVIIPGGEVREVDHVEPEDPIRFDRILDGGDVVGEAEEEE
jgi:tetratricopeptide (TPR) repeat protein